MSRKVLVNTDFKAAVNIDHTVQHIRLRDTDRVDFTNHGFIVDVNGEIGRLFWYENPTFFEKLRLYGPAHATQAHDVAFYDSAGAVALLWDDSISAWYADTIVCNDILYAYGFRLRGGPDTGDTWELNLTDAGDSFSVVLQDASAGGLRIERFKVTPTEILLSEDPISPLGAATKQYVDASGGGTPHVVDAIEPASPTDGLLWTNPDEDPIPTTFPGYFPGPQLKYDTAGSYTFTKAAYPNLRAIEVEMVAGGGGSGGTQATIAGDSAISGAGGGGSYSKSLILASDLDVTEAITVGAAGAAGASGLNAGGPGGDSVFDTISGEVRANGGAGGNGGATTTSPVTGTYGSPGPGGVAGTGDLVIAGNSGTPGFALAQNRLWPGAGGASVFSPGAIRGQDNAKTVGVTGRPYGGGAGSSYAQQSQTAGPGAVGAAGLVLVRLLY